MLVFWFQQTLLVYTSFQKPTSNKEDSLRCLFVTRNRSTQINSESNKRKSERINDIVAEICSKICSLWSPLLQLFLLMAADCHPYKTVPASEQGEAHQDCFFMYSSKSSRPKLPISRSWTSFIPESQAVLELFCMAMAPL